jgi:hypothetical protein
MEVIEEFWGDGVSSGISLVSDQFSEVLLK